MFGEVFAPNEYVFLAGEYDFAGMLVERFAGFHIQCYGGYKVYEIVRPADNKRFRPDNDINNKDFISVDMKSFFVID